MLLEEEGHVVLSFRNGQEILDYLRGGSAPALILLDMMMPVMDGMTFLQRRAEDPRLERVPVVVITAGTVSEQLPKTQGLIKKPISLVELLDVVRTYC